MALQVALHGYVLETGRVAVEGRAKELQTNLYVRRTYLGMKGEETESLCSSTS
jgi:branched-chain amino acid transport system ATP-binding protein